MSKRKQSNPQQRRSEEVKRFHEDVADEVRFDGAFPPLADHPMIPLAANKWTQKDTLQRGGRLPQPAAGSNKLRMKISAVTTSKSPCLFVPSSSSSSSSSSSEQPYFVGSIVAHLVRIAPDLEEEEGEEEGEEGEEESSSATRLLFPSTQAFDLDFLWWDVSTTNSSSSSSFSSSSWCATFEGSDEGCRLLLPDQVGLEVGKAIEQLARQQMISIEIFPGAKSCTLLFYVQPCLFLEPADYPPTEVPSKHINATIQRLNTFIQFLVLSEQLGVEVDNMVLGEGLHNSPMNIFDLHGGSLVIQPSELFQRLKPRQATRPTISQHEAIKLNLRQYQLRAVEWFLSRETASPLSTTLHPLWVSLRVHAQGAPVYYSHFTGAFSLEPRFHRNNLKGGILADEMGLGKTLEVTTAILMHQRPADGEEQQIQHIETEKLDVLPSHDLPDTIVEIEAALMEPTMSQTLITPQQPHALDMSRILDEEPVTPVNGGLPFVDAHAMENELAPMIDEGPDLLIVEQPESQTSVANKKKKPRKKKVASEKTIEQEHPEIPQSKISGVIKCFCGSLDEMTGTLPCSLCGCFMHSKCCNYHGDENNFICAYCLTQGCQKLKSRATLIVSPESITHQWVSEMKMYLGDSFHEKLKVLRYEGVVRDGFISPQTLAEYDVIFTTYSVLQADFNYLFEDFDGRSRRHARRYFPKPTPLPCLEFWRLVLDEAQMIEHSTSRAAMLASKLSAVNRWCVTGTPVSTGIDELHGIMKFLGVDPFDCPRWWGALVKTDSLVRTLETIMWRTEKADVHGEINLCEPIHLTASLHMDAASRFSYNRLHEQLSTLFFHVFNTHGLETDDPTPFVQLPLGVRRSLLHPLYRLRQSCCHASASQRAVGLPHGHGGAQAHNKPNESSDMKVVLQKMAHGAEMNCTNAYRSVTMARNGIAGLALLLGKRNEALAMYWKVILDCRQRSSDFPIDPYQLLHAVHNYLEVASITAQDCSSPDFFPDVGSNYFKALTMADQRVYAQDVETEGSSVSEGSSSLTEDVTKSPNHAWLSVLRRAIIKDKQSDAQVYLNQALHALSESKSSYFGHDKAFSQWFDTLAAPFGEDGVPVPLDETHRHDLEAHVIEQIQRKMCTGEEKLVPQFRTLAGCQYVLVQHVDAINAKRQALLEKVHELVGKESDDHFRHAASCQKCRKRHGVDVCDYCLLEFEIAAYNSFVFNASSEEVLFEDDSDGFRYSARKEKGAYQGVSEFEHLLRELASIVRRQRGGVPYLQEMIKHIALLKKESLAMTKVRLALYNRVSVRDELAMCTRRLALYPSADLFVEEAELVAYVDDPAAKYRETLMDEKTAMLEFLKERGRLRYLKSLGEEGLVEECPVCRSEHANHRYAVLFCGHTLCHMCVRRIEQRRELACPFCRQVTSSADYEWVVTSSSSSSSSAPASHSGPREVPPPSLSTALLSSDVDPAGFIQEEPCSSSSLPCSSSSSSSSPRSLGLDSALGGVSGRHLVEKGNEKEKANPFAATLKSLHSVPIHGSPGMKFASVLRKIIQIQDGLFRPGGPSSHVGDAQEEKCIVFCEWPSILSLFAEVLRKNHILYFYPRSQKEVGKMVPQFKADLFNNVLLLELNLGGNGLNLTEANHVLFLEPPISPALELQAIGRIDRIGQRKQTFVHHFIMEDSIESNIFRESMRKKTQGFHRSLASEDHLDITVRELALLFEMKPTRDEPYFDDRRPEQRPNDLLEEPNPVSSSSIESEAQRRMRSKSLSEQSPSLLSSSSSSSDSVDSSTGDPSFRGGLSPADQALWWEQKVMFRNQALTRLAAERRISTALSYVTGQRGTRMYELAGKSVSEAAAQKLVALPLVSPEPTRFRQLTEAYNFEFNMHNL